MKCTVMEFWEHGRCSGGRKEEEEHANSTQKDSEEPRFKPSCEETLQNHRSSPHLRIFTTHTHTHKQTQTSELSGVFALKKAKKMIFLQTQNKVKHTKNPANYSET